MLFLTLSPPFRTSLLLSQLIHFPVTFIQSPPSHVTGWTLGGPHWVDLTLLYFFSYSIYSLTNPSKANRPFNSKCIVKANNLFGIAFAAIPSIEKEWKFCSVWQGMWKHLRNRSGWHSDAAKRTAPSQHQQPKHIPTILGVFFYVLLVTECVSSACCGLLA